MHFDSDKSEMEIVDTGRYCTILVRFEGWSLHYFGAP